VEILLIILWVVALYRTLYELSPYRSLNSAVAVEIRSSQNNQNCNQHQLKSSSEVKPDSIQTKSISGSSGRTDSQEFITIEPISHKEPEIKRAKQLYSQGIHLYQINQLEAAANLFRETAQILEPFKSKYPNSLELYFYLLESYEGFDRNRAVDCGYKCLEIFQQVSEIEYTKVISSDYDVNRKLYKLLINRNRIDEAKACARKTWKLAQYILDIGKVTLNEEVQRKLVIEGIIATYFQKGLLDGRDMRRNLVDGIDSPELWYKFERQTSPQDAELLNQFASMGVFSFQ